MTKHPDIETNLFELSEKARTGLLLLSAHHNISPNLAVKRLVEDAAKDDFAVIRLMLSTDNKTQPKNPEPANR